MEDERCINKKCEFYDELMVSNCSKGINEAWFPNCENFITKDSSSLQFQSMVSHDIMEASRRYNQCVCDALMKNIPEELLKLVIPYKDDISRIDRARNILEMILDYIG